MGLSLAVTEKRSFPVWGNFRDSSSEITENIPFEFWSDGSIVCRHRDMVISGLGKFSALFVKIHQKLITLASVGWVYRLPWPRNGHFQSAVTFVIFRQKSSKKAI
jgi:hypothetical protein